MRSQRERIKDPGDNEAGTDEVAKDLEAIFQPVGRGRVFRGEDSEGDGDEKPEEGHSEKMGHAFLPIPISKASIAASILSAPATQMKLSPYSKVTLAACSG